MIWKQLSAGVLAFACGLSFGFAQEGAERPRPKEAGKHPGLQRAEERTDRDAYGKGGPREREQRKEQLSRAEHIRESWQRFQTEHPQVAAKMRAEADANADGKIDPKEREAAREKYRDFEKRRREEFEAKHKEAAERRKERADQNDDNKAEPRERELVKGRRDRADGYAAAKAAPKDQLEVHERRQAEPIRPRGDQRPRKK